MKKILAALLFICTVWGAGAQERKSMDNQTIDGYRGIWFTIGQAVRATATSIRADWAPTP